MRPPSFCNPKRVIAPQWEQIGPKFVFPVFQVEITRNHWHRPNLKPNDLLDSPMYTELQSAQGIY